MKNKQSRHILLLSGGKDSTALAIFMYEQHPEIDMEYVFCDTHKELPETYKYLSKLEGRLCKPIVRLSSDLGERGFDHWLTIFRGYLPSPKMRWCTRELKIQPFEKYVGDDKVYLYIGIRADEQRGGYISTKPSITAVYPFKEAGLTKLEVLRILKDSRIGLPEYYNWRSRSGCFFCFFQRKIEWIGLLETHPTLFEAAKAYEKPEENYTWIEGESLEDLARPERIAQIREEETRRKARITVRRKPRTLAEIFAGEYVELNKEYRST